MIANDFCIIVNVTRNCASANVTRRTSIVSSITRNRNLFRLSTRITSGLISAILLNISFNYRIGRNEVPTTRLTIKSNKRSSYFFLNISGEDRLRRNFINVTINVKLYFSKIRFRLTIRSFLRCFTKLIRTSIILSRRSTKSITFITRDYRNVRFHYQCKTFMSGNIFCGTVNTIRHSMTICRVPFLRN